MPIEEIWGKAQEYKIQQIKEEFIEVLKLLPLNSTGMEIGCYSGGTTISFSLICSKLCTIDLSKIYNTSEVEGYCQHKFIIGNSTDPEVISEAYNFTGPLDFLFIDGDHTEEGAYKDYLNYKSFVKPGGYIFFHDIVDTESHRSQNCFVSRAWNRVKENHKYMEFISGASWGGIGAIQI